MVMPRDDNLRLIGAEEEARHILEHLRSASYATMFCLLSAAACLGVGYFVVTHGDWIGLFTADRETALIWAALACSLSCFFSTFYGARVVRYLWYRHQHQTFLRKYNRL